ncbi:MAG: aromatic ring-hydroxylating dioxygenase subunit alpha [Dehalococcoidia bacterium]|nr:aromatic ring-hydroxylating dioxygenase subunit alpha [Dehalococcoidia bacterium]
MLTPQENERITRVGPGTPMGALLRRYWMPVAAAAELAETPVRKVRLLGEDLVLFRDRSGVLGLIDEPCPHRRVSMEYGIPEESGLRCPYHGWLFDHAGRCTEQPAEPWNSTFKDRVATRAYPVQELAGLVFAYLGPQPAPLLPRYDLFVWDDVVRHIGITELPCNYLQCMENGLDPSHAEWLHGYYMRYIYGRKGETIAVPMDGARHHRFRFDVFEHGMITRRIVEGASEEDDIWRIGASVVFPITRRVGTTFQIRVPIDDTHTRHYNYVVMRPGIPVPPQDAVPVYELPLLEQDGKYNIEVLLVQDFMCWSSQGPIARRDLERLGQSDIGIIFYRELVREQLDRVERGEEPIEVYRDPDKNTCIALPDVNSPRRPAQMITGSQSSAAGDLKYSPIRDLVLSLREEAAEHIARGGPLLPAPELPVYPMGDSRHRELQLLPG